MRLGDFILANMEPILAEWEAFARSFAAGATMDPVALRDHAEQILRAAALDMSSDQSASQQSDKSQGRGEGGADSLRLNGASEEHAIERVGSGFDLIAVVAEYRALRASVIRLWRKSTPSHDVRDMNDLTRFNESIDQSLAKAVRSYTERVNRSRQMFLAILGHDLRNPLNSMTLSAQVLLRTAQFDEEGARTATGIATSAQAMGRMIGDLLDFTGAGLGAAMPIAPEKMDLRTLCDEVLQEMRAAQPTCTITLETSGELTGEWDRERLRQVLSNLLGNAVQHGSANCSVKLSVRGDDTHVHIIVNNQGAPIPPDAIATIFDPLVRITSPELQRRRRPGSIGLGLYIAREVVTAHGGTIDVKSSAESGTTFTARLPRMRPK